MSEVTWTLMYTSVTRTTTYGYSTTCTLADAMANRARNETYEALTNLAHNLGVLGYWLRIAPRRRKRKQRE